MSDCHGLVSECLQCRWTDTCQRYPSSDESRAMRIGHDLYGGVDIDLSEREKKLKYDKRYQRQKRWELK